MEPEAGARDEEGEGLRRVHDAGLFIFWPHSAVASKILVPHPGVEPVLPALGVWNLKHWTAKGVPTELS